MYKCVKLHFDIYHRDISPSATQCRAVCLLKDRFVCFEVVSSPSATPHSVVEMLWDRGDEQMDATTESASALVDAPKTLWHAASHFPFRRVIAV